MALRDWISNSGRVATATVATLATLNPEKQRTVATVATVSVARVGKKGKTSTIETVPTLPRWCCANCPGIETIPLAKEGDVAGCVNPVNGTWRRLDRLTEYPAMEKAARPAVPSGCCGNACEHFHRVEIPDLTAVAWCCSEQDSKHWRRLRIGAMRKCPMEMQP